MLSQTDPVIYPNALTWFNVGDFCTFGEKMPILPPDFPINLILLHKNGQNPCFWFQEPHTILGEYNHAILWLFYALLFNKYRVFIENALFTPAFGKKRRPFLPLDKVGGSA